MDMRRGFRPGERVHRADQEPEGRLEQEGPRGRREEVNGICRCLSCFLRLRMARLLFRVSLAEDFFAAEVIEGEGFPEARDERRWAHWKAELWIPTWP